MEVPRTEINGGSVDVPFLSFKAFGRQNLRLSPLISNGDLWAGPTRIFAVANSIGWFAAGRNQSIILSPLSDLREAFKSPQTPFQARISVPLNLKPTTIVFAYNNERLVVGQTNGVISVFDTSLLRSMTSPETLNLLHEFTHSSEPVRDIQPNPFDRPGIVAVLRGEASRGTRLEMLDVAIQPNLINAWDVRGGQNVQTCIAWSPKGKQIAVGDVSGNLIHYTADGIPKNSISPPRDRISGWFVASVAWLENSVFHITYGTSGVSSDQQDFQSYTIINEKASRTDIALPDPAPPFGDRSRESARLNIGLRDWGRLKHLVVVADAPSTDVGLVGQLEQGWALLDLDETARIVLPMDENSQDTYALGVALDLTATEPIASVEAPPSPIVYVYTNTGDLAAYHIINMEAGQYSGMVSIEGLQSSGINTSMSMDASAANTPADGAFGQSAAATPAFGSPATFIQSSSSGAKSAMSPFAQPGFSAFASPSKGGFGSQVSPSPSAFTSGSASAAKPSAFGAGSGAFGSASVFGSVTSSSPSAFGQPGAFGNAASKPAFGQSSFGQTSAFGQSIAFGSTQSATSPAFGSPTAFGTSPSTSSTVNSSSAPASGGFASFAKPSGLSGFAALASSGTNVLNAQSPRNGGGMEVNMPSPMKETPITSPNTTSVFGAPSTSSNAFDSLRSGTSAFSRAVNAQPVAAAFGGSPSNISPPVAASPPVVMPKSSPFGNSGLFGVPTSTTAGAALSASAFTRGYISSPNEPLSPPGRTLTTSPFSEGSPGTVKIPESPPSSATPLAPFSQGFLGTSTGTSAFARAAQQSSSTPPAVTAFGSAKIPPAPVFGASPTFVVATPGTAPKFGVSSFGAPPPAAAQALTTTTAAVPIPSPNLGGGFASFASKSGGGFASFTNKSGSPSAFASAGSPKDDKPGTSSIFGTQNGKLNSAQSFRSSSLSVPNDDAGDDQPRPEKFAEELISNREPEKIADDSIGALFGGGETSLQRLTAAGPSGASQGMSLGGFGAALPSIIPPPPSKPPSPKHTAVVETTVETPGSSEASGSDEEDDKEEEDEGESTTPTSSPTKPLVVTTDPSIPKAPPSVGIGLGRPPSGSNRLAVPTASSPFNSVPTRSSPLAATPPINRKDVTDSPSPPKPARTNAGGMFSKKALTAIEDDDEEEDEDELEDFLKEREAKTAAKATAKSPSPVAPSVKPQASVSPPLAASAPVSDTPKVIPRARTPPLSGFGFGGGGKKTSASIAAFSKGYETTKPLTPVLTSEVAVRPTVKSPAFLSNVTTPKDEGRQSFLAPAWTSAPSAPFPSTFGEPANATAASPPKTEPAKAANEEQSGIHGQVNQIVFIMDKELGQLRDIATQCNDLQQRIVESKHRGGVLRFRDVDQWSLGDLKTLRRQTDDLEDDTNKLEDDSLLLKKEIVQLQSLLLKAETSKQEIERFLRARNDKNFARLLNVRALGPEHLENQTRLRRSIQLTHDRVQQLEDQMAVMKQKVQQAKTGQRPLRAPSLDTIARAISNIEAAALEKRNEMNSLTERIEALNLNIDSDDSDSDTASVSSSSPPPMKRNIREATPLDTILARPTLTPKIKAVSANALNAERAALRLRGALLTIRSTPLLNTRAVPKPSNVTTLDQGLTVIMATIDVPKRASLKTPVKETTTSSKTSPFGGKIDASAFANWKIPTVVDLPQWDPSDQADEQEDISDGRRGGSMRNSSGRYKHKQSVRPSGSPSPAPIKSSSSPEGSKASAVPAFDWGFHQMGQTDLKNPPGFVSLLNFVPKGEASAISPPSFLAPTAPSPKLSGTGLKMEPPKASTIFVPPTLPPSPFGPRPGGTTNTVSPFISMFSNDAQSPGSSPAFEVGGNFKSFSTPDTTSVFGSNFGGGASIFGGSSKVGDTDKTRPSPSFNIANAPLTLSSPFGVKPASNWAPPTDKGSPSSFGHQEKSSPTGSDAVNNSQFTLGSQASSKKDDSRSRSPPSTVGAGTNPLFSRLGPKVEEPSDEDGEGNLEAQLADALSEGYNDEDGEGTDYGEGDGPWEEGDEDYWEGEGEDGEREPAPV